MARMRRKGEPHIFRLDPSGLDAFLDARGFDLVENLTGMELNSTYIRPLGRSITSNKYSAVAYATVKDSAATR
jgi:O-methyltransferase involved in polyketide biosynthesis